MSFNCSSCLKSFKSNWHLSRHSERKYPCKAVSGKSKVSIGKSKVSIGSVKSKYPVSQKSVFGKSKVSIPEGCGNTEVSATNVVNIPSKSYNCIYCNKVYNHKQSKYNHQKKCKIYQNNKKKEDNIKKIIKKLEKNNKSIILANQNNEEVLKIRNNNKIKETDIILSNLEIEEEINITNLGCNTNSGNTTNSGNSTNTTNSVNTTNSGNTTNSNNTVIINHINPFGKENLDSISEATILKILNTRFNSFQTAMETIHKDIPENCNFFLPNKSDRKFITYYNGKECVYETTNKFKDKLSDKIMGQLETWFEKYNSKFIKRQQTILKNVFNEYYDGNLEERYNTEIDKFLLSHSNEIKKIITTTLQTIDD